MGQVERFEDLIAWQKARELARTVYRLTRTQGLAGDHALAVQMRRAAVSVMSNIAEGFERSGPKEFQHFLATAKSSCAEIRSQSYVALDAGHLTRPQFDELHRQALEVGKILGGLRSAVARRMKSGPPRGPQEE